jgi:hypothetical protein
MLTVKQPGGCEGEADLRMWLVSFRCAVVSPLGCLRGLECGVSSLKGRAYKHGEAAEALSDLKSEAVL